MGKFSIRNEEAIREAIQTACERSELLILVTPYIRFESSFVRLDVDAIQVAASMSREDAQFGLRHADLRMRFPVHQKFLEAPTQVLGFGAAAGRPTVRLAIPDHIDEDDHRSAYRVDHLGRVGLTFSTRKYELMSGTLVNMSVTGARIHSLKELEEGEVRAEDLIAITIPLAEGITINTRAKVRYVQERSIGLEFRPPIEGPLLERLSRWVFLKREEDLERASLASSRSEVSKGPAPSEGIEGLLLLSSDAALEGVLLELLGTAVPLHRRAANFQSLKELAPGGRNLVLFHLHSLDLDSRKRLRMLLDSLPPKIPFVLLGIGVDQGALTEFSTEVKATGTCMLDPVKPSPFLPRLIQGIWRRHFEQGV
jgi:hypothetical protein